MGGWMICVEKWHFLWRITFVHNLHNFDLSILLHDFVFCCQAKMRLMQHWSEVISRQHFCAYNYYYRQFITWKGSLLPGPLRGLLGPSTKNNSEPSSIKFNFSNAQILSFRIFQCDFGCWAIFQFRVSQTVGRDPNWGHETLPLYEVSACWQK